jgi:hypothetical protein
MPCTYYETQAEINARNSEKAAARQKIIDDLDRLTHENDMLREALLTLANEHESEYGNFDYFPISEDVLNLIGKNQVKHRKEDLKRLKKVFMQSKDAEKLGLVMLADPTKPLEPQLGFDPDAF